MYALLLISAILLIIAATDNFISMFTATSIVLFAVSAIGIIFAPHSNIILNIIVTINVITDVFILAIISYRLYQKAKVKASIALHLTASILYIAMIIVNLFKIFVILSARNEFVLEFDGIIAFARKSHNQIPKNRQRFRLHRSPWRVNERNRTV